MAPMLQCAWLLLMLHFAEVEGDCLSDAIPLAQRKNLTALDLPELAVTAN